MTIPGVGPVTALSLLAVIGDVTRFPSAGQLVGYLGLDPRVRQSGERPARTGHISRAGQAHARGLLVEAAHVAIRTPGPLRAFHARIKAKRGAQVALCATARKLAVLSWHLLSTGEDYRYSAPTIMERKLRRLQRQAGDNGPKISLAGLTPRPRAAPTRRGRTQLPRPRRRTNKKRRGCHQWGSDSDWPSKGKRCATGPIVPTACSSRRGHPRQEES
jgi:hypothetical protein